MERKYKAFISYRHRPVDTDTAVRLHRIIESFTIPPRLRKNGEKKLGLVFRDRDELPTSSNLSESIRLALDNSEFLIVICTPATSESQWVLREISYFLEHHDRDHVLAVLADGTPEEAFPTLLTERTDKNGDLLEEIEPLAANIVADSDRKRRSLLKKESLRLLAALIGCAYDELYQRQQRRRKRLAAASLLTMGLVALAFISMLLLKNAQIREQLRHSQINESKVLAFLSENEYAAGNYRGAIEYALQALPSAENDRPYVPQAEAALASVLNVYDRSDFNYLQSYQQASEIASVAVSEDGRCFAATDYYGRLYWVESQSGSVLWSQDTGWSDLSFETLILDHHSLLVALLPGETIAYDLDNGSPVWKLGCSLAAISEAGETAVCCDEAGRLLLLIDMGSGTTICSCPLGESASDYFAATEGSIAADTAHAALVLSDFSSNLLLIWDIKENNITEIPLNTLPDGGFYDLGLMFMDDGDLLCAWNDSLQGSGLLRFDRENHWAEAFSTTLEAESTTGLIWGDSFFLGGVQLLTAHKDSIVLCTLKNIYTLDAGTGALRGTIPLPDLLLNAHKYANGTIGLALINGEATVFSAEDGQRGLDSSIAGFGAGFDLSAAALSGNNFDTSTFVLVPGGRSNIAAVVQKRQPDNEAVILDYEDNKDLLNAGQFCTSPSGGLSALVRHDYDASLIHATLIDNQKRCPIREYSFSCDTSLRSSNVYLTDSAKLICGGLVVDMNNEETAGLSLDGTPPKTYTSVWRSAVNGNHQTLTAAVLTEDHEKYSLLYWTDGEPTGSIDLQPGFFGLAEIVTADCIGLGGNGFALLSLKEDHSSPAAYFLCSLAAQEWYRIEPEGDDSDLLFAMGEERSCCAFIEDNTLYLADIAESERTACRTEGLPLQALEHLMFALNDHLLFAFFNNGETAVFDVENGQLLSSQNYGDMGLAFNSSDFGRYSTCLTQDGEKLIVIYNGSNTESLCFILDLAAMDVSGIATGIVGYCPETNDFIVKPDYDDLYSTPLLSLEEIMAAADKALRPHK